MARVLTETEERVLRTVVEGLHRPRIRRKRRTEREEGLRGRGAYADQSGVRDDKVGGRGSDREERLCRASRGRRGGDGEVRVRTARAYPRVAAEQLECKRLDEARTALGRTDVRSAVQCLSEMEAFVVRSGEDVSRADVLPCHAVDATAEAVARGAVREDVEGDVLVRLRRPDVRHGDAHARSAAEIEAVCRARIGIDRLREEAVEVRGARERRRGRVEESAGESESRRCRRAVGSGSERGRSAGSRAAIASRARDDAVYRVETLGAGDASQYQVSGGAACGRRADKQIAASEGKLSCGCRGAEPYLRCKEGSRRACGSAGADVEYACPSARDTGVHRTALRRA